VSPGRGRSTLLVLPALVPSVLVLAVALGAALLQSTGLLPPVGLPDPGLSAYAVPGGDLGAAVLISLAVAAGATACAALVGLLTALVVVAGGRRGRLVAALSTLTVPLPHLVAAAATGLLLADSGLLARLTGTTAGGWPQWVASPGWVAVGVELAWKESAFIALVVTGTLAVRGPALLEAAAVAGHAPAGHAGAGCEQRAVVRLRGRLLRGAVPTWAHVARAAAGAGVSALHLDRPGDPAAGGRRRRRHDRPVCRFAGRRGGGTSPERRMAVTAPAQAAGRPAPARPAAWGARRPWAAAGLAVWFALPLVPLLLWAFADRWTAPAVLPQRWGLRGLGSAMHEGAPAALGHSALLGLAVAVLATTAGALAGRALALGQVPAARLVTVLLVAPVAVPGFVLAVGLDAVLLRARVPGLVGVVLVLTVAALPYTTWAVRRVRRVRPRLRA